MKKITSIIATIVFVAFTAIIVFKLIDSISNLQGYYSSYTGHSPYQHVNELNALAFSLFWTDVLFPALGAGSSVVGIIFIFLKKNDIVFKVMILTIFLLLGGRFTYEMFQLAVSYKISVGSGLFVFDPKPYIIAYDVIFGVGVLSIITAIVFMFFKTDKMKIACFISVVIASICWLSGYIVDARKLSLLKDTEELVVFYARYFPVSIIVVCFSLELIFNLKRKSV